MSAVGKQRLKENNKEHRAARTGWQADLREFKTNLFYITSSRPISAVW